MKIVYTTILMCVISILSVNAQLVREPDGGNSFEALFPRQDDMTPLQRSAIIEMLKYQENKLRQEGKFDFQNRTAVTAFEWPLKQAAGFNDIGYYGISNYVDENPNYPNLILDYNCGNRTYDQSSGYNHQGTDIFTWPFTWQKMDQNAVEVIAAAPGTILAKSDGNFDKNCAFCTSSCSWNAVYVMHSDGSVAWYGHLKTGTLTTKAVGQSVATGEYLGVVGSSGNSTGPHLHFEVYTNSSYTKMVSPWAGPCNVNGVPNGNTSWWANQQPYYVPTLLKVMTHGAAPALGACPAAESVNSKVNFVNGEQVFLGSYYRDQQAGQSALHKVYQPNNSLYTSWTQNLNANYNASYWYYIINLPNPAQTGTWKYEITYAGGQVVTTQFAVNTVLPLHLVGFNAKKMGNLVRLHFNTKNETNLSHFNIMRSSNGRDFSTLKTISATNQIENFYETTDEQPLQVNYYKLEMVERDGQKRYSETQKVVFEKRGDYLQVAGNPFINNLSIRLIQPVQNAGLSLVNANGQVIYAKDFSSLAEGTINIPTTGLPAGLYFIVVRSNHAILDKLTVLKL